MSTSNGRGALSVGQLAKRWNVTPNRVRALIAQEKLPGTFTIPAAGRYGEVTKIPVATVQAAEAEWAVVGQITAVCPRRRRRNSTAVLEHLPELSVTPEHAAESPGDGQH